jgi:hypothetical protein
MSTTFAPSRLLTPGQASRVTLENLANFTPFRGRNIAIVGCGDGRLGEAVNVIEKCSGATWHYNTFRPGGTFAITGEMAEIDPCVALDPAKVYASLVEEIGYVERRLIAGARAAGQPVEEVMFSVIVDLRHLFCAAAHFNVGNTPLDQQIMSIRAGQDRAAPMLLGAFPRLPVAQMVYDHRDNRWY